MKVTNYRLINGDSRDLSFLRDESVHLVVTSPPYWNLKKYNENPNQLGHIKDYETFLSELEKVWRHIYRLLVPGGRMVCVVGDVCVARRKFGRHLVFPLHADICVTCRHIGFDNLNPIIWHKIANASYEVTNGSKFLGKPYEPNAIIKNDIEFILMQRKPGGYRQPSNEQRERSRIVKDEFDRWFQQIWNIPGASTRQHPAPFPLELANRLVRMFSFFGDTVLDPFCGSEAKLSYNSGKPYIGRVWYGAEFGTTGHYPDLGRRQVREWWGTQYQYLFDMGLEFVWQDMTTPAIPVYKDQYPYGDMKGFPFQLMLTDDFLSCASDRETVKNRAIRIWNLYSYNLHKATYHGLNYLKGRENKRNFIIGRGCFTGMHRFAGLWTGDNASTWDFLQINVAQVLSLGMCGLAMSGQDIGGFESNDDEQWADPALLIRWTIAGAFLPWFRNHYIRKGKKHFQEPFMYIEWFNEYRGGILPEPQELYRKVMPICRHYIQLRYRLIQLFYDAMFENMFNGLPICRPMFINEPDDRMLFDGTASPFLDNQFFIRNDLLVAPLIEPEDQSHGSREVYLPDGSRWYCFMDNAQPLSSPVSGGTVISYDAYLDDSDTHIRFLVPMYVREGAVIPTIELEQYVGELNDKKLPNPITLNIYPCNDPGQSKVRKYTMYLDDGVSRSSAPKSLPQYSSRDEQEIAESNYRETLISHQFITQRSRVLTVERIVDNYTPVYEKYFFVAILHDPSETQGANGPLSSVSVDGKEISSVASRSLLDTSPTDTWFYNTSNNITFIKILDKEPKIKIDMEYL